MILKLNKTEAFEQLRENVDFLNFLFSHISLMTFWEEKKCPKKNQLYLSIMYTFYQNFRPKKRCVLYAHKIFDWYVKTTHMVSIYTVDKYFKAKFSMREKHFKNFTSILNDDLGLKGKKKNYSGIPQIFSNS